MRILLAVVAAGLALCVNACTPPGMAAAGRGSLQAFESEAELRRFVRNMASREQALARAVVFDAAPSPMAYPGDDAVDAAAEEAPASASAQVTNVQEAGVDEGGIVKAAGDYFIVLRRGRLFTIRHGGSALEPVDEIDAFPPGEEDPRAWYDEMLVAGDQVVVIGYSYGDFGTEVSRFRLSPDGQLTYRDTHYLSSGDYYSSSNYASRLIGDELVLYTPQFIDWTHWRETMPAIQRRPQAGKATVARPLLDASRIYLATPYRGGDQPLEVIHTVTRCDLAAAELECAATGVIGSASRSFYVARDAVYVWTGAAHAFGARPSDESVDGLLYRLPFDDRAPGAIQVEGGPIDQFSFQEDRVAEVLRVLLRDDGAGDWMWSSEDSTGAFALVEVPLGEFGDGGRALDKAAYRRLPAVSGYRVQNRFVGRHLLYAAADYGTEDRAAFLYAVPLEGGDPVRVALPHGVTRLDVLGADGVAVGPTRSEALGFSAIRLDAAAGTAALEDTYLLPAAREGEVRSQAFFFRADPDSSDGKSGMLGLPVTRERARAGAEFLGSGSAVAFLRRQGGRLSSAGELVADDAGARNDHCQASCVDWYGNARPIFLGNRVFALMGYELVEGRAADGRIAELRRVDFTPRETLARHGD